MNRAGFSNINCPTTPSKLVAGGDCIFSYQIDATPNPENFAIKATGDGADASALSLPIHVALAGHLVFSQRGLMLTALNLGPNASGEVTLTNTGGSPITNLMVSHLTEPGFSNLNCGTTLAPGDSCQFSYATGSTPASVSFTIIASGIGADDNALPLPVHIASAGHLVFSQRGLMLTALNLGPNASGEVTLTNTGGSAVTNVMVSHLTEPGFSNLNCGTTLAPGGSCQFSYATGSTPADVSFTIIASGRGADDNALPLLVKITSLGHFEFRQNGKLITTLNLKQHDKGTIKLYNTGDTVISDILMSNYNQEDPDFIVFGCLGGQYPKGARFSLKPHQFCKIEYYIGTYTKYDKDMSFSISAQGENVDNNPTLLNINISKE